MQAGLRRVLSVSILIVLLGMPLSAMAAQGQATFTLTIKSAFAHSSTSLESRRAASLFEGQPFVVTGRSADGQWLRLDYAGAPTEVWILAALGNVGGDLNSVPVAAAAELAELPSAQAAPAGPAQLAPALTLPAFQSDNPVIPTVSQTAIDIYRRGLQLGNNPRAFSKIGDCQSVVPYFLAAFDYGPSLYNLGPYSALQATIDNFAGSWANDSITSNRGFNVATVFVPLWSDPKRCLRNETPLACEFRIIRPSLAVITMETWWGGDPAGYESYLRGIVEFSIAHGTVPILATKADNFEGGGAINAVIIKLAHEYNVPLWNFWAAVQPLPSHGLIADGFHLTWARNYFNDPAVMQNAWPWRNLTALQAIDAVWRGVNRN